MRSVESILTPCEVMIRRPFRELESSSTSSIAPYSNSPYLFGGDVLGGEVLSMLAIADALRGRLLDEPSSGVTGSDTSSIVSCRASVSRLDLDSSSPLKYDSRCIWVVRGRVGDAGPGAGVSDRAYDASSAVSSLTLRAYCALSTGAVITLEQIQL